MVGVMFITWVIRLIRGAKGLLNEAAGATVDFRLAEDQGTRTGELGPNSTQEELAAPFTLCDVVRKFRVGGKSAPVGIGKV